MRAAAGRLATFTLSAALLGACNSATVPSTIAPSSSPTTAAPTSGSAFVPTFATHACPDDVTANVVIPVSCGFLTVVEDRSKPAGRTIQILVARFDPPGGTSTPDPVIALGPLASQDGYGDMSQTGQRTHRVLYLLDPRGVGHSIPSLDCPEVPAVGSEEAGLRLRDPARAALVAKAVGACHDRLVAQGIDLSAYDIAANAADVADLVSALKIGSWNLATYGASAIGLEIAGRYPSGLRSLIIDSPSLLSPDYLSVGPAALDGAIARLVVACSADAACTRAYPDTGAMIRNAISKLDAKPVTLDVTGTVDAIRLGHPIRVVVDGAALVRILRFGLGADGGSRAAQALATVRDAIDGTLSAADPDVQAIAADTGDCVGLVPICEAVGLGALYSIMCRDVAGQVDGPRLAAAIAGRPAYADVFSPSPLLAPCAAWGVAPAAASTGGAPAAASTGGAPADSVPTLILRGAFDPYSALPSDVTKALGGPNVYVVNVPNQSYNTLGFTECPRAIRNSWIDAPTAPPDTSCLANIPPLALTP
jgi:pimeloyl-ACP methyl ester carboxylesterase